MAPYTPPLDHMHFVLNQVLHAPAQWAAIPALADLDAATAQAVLQEAGRFAAEVLAPTNAPGDLQGCTLQDGQVRTPTGFREAYASFVEGGWPALACAPEAGGQGLSQALNAALYEMLVSANHAWTMYPGLLHGAYEVLLHHAVPALKERYLGKVTSGQWLATMCLTEAQAGSDLGLVRTKAVPEAGAPLAGGVPLRISGNKIFISGGDHDLTDNIVHLVLCRLVDAPAGTKGLSLALVPKFLPDGTRNAVFCDGLEKKMGIKGSATCQMRFDNAQGWLLGEPNRGLAAMFLMMNAARLHVALQGLAHLEAATQNAWAYALERVQMRAAQRPEGSTPAAADPIAWHPAMRRTLWGLRARADGARVLALHTALRLDAAEQHPDPEERRRAADDVALLTPVLKAFFTHIGHHGADEALGVFGGYGFVHDYGIEQNVRDSRIAMIYEGTNEIQALDLLQRKVLDDGGQRLAALLGRLGDEADRCDAAGQGEAARALRDQLRAWQQATQHLLQARAADPGQALRVADDYLHGAGHALLAWAWAALARAAAASHEADPQAQRALQVARFGRQWLLPQAGVHWQRVMAQGVDLPWLA